MMKITAVFRVDASLEIGSGHVVRCLTLARALRLRGWECWFLTRPDPENVAEVIDKNGFKVIRLSSAKTPIGQSDRQSSCSSSDEFGLDIAWQADAAECKLALGEIEVDLLIVDHYSLDSRWETSMRAHCGSIMVIDDLADRAHDCDFLLDQNFVADFNKRYDSLIPETCGRMLGPEFALLHSDYSKFRSVTAFRESSIKRIMIYFGGADGANLSGMAISAIGVPVVPDLQIDVVISEKSPHWKKIKQQVSGDRRVSIHSDLETLAPLMSETDLVVGAGGATSWERCCLGVPAIVISLAGNQVALSRKLHNYGAIHYLGHKDSVSESILREAIGAFLRAPRSKESYELCKDLVDGRGTERVIDVLTLNQDSELLIKRIVLQDEDWILELANDPMVRRNSFRSDPISREEHHRWFRRQIEDHQDTRFYKWETRNGMRVGQVRFRREGSRWEIHYSLSSVARGKGLGKRLLMAAIDAFQSDTDAQLLVGRVKDSNFPSRKIFTALGFDVSQSDDVSTIEYQKRLRGAFPTKTR